LGGEKEERGGKWGSRKEGGREKGRKEFTCKSFTYRMIQPIPRRGRRGREKEKGARLVRRIEGEEGGKGE